MTEVPKKKRGLQNNEMVRGYGWPRKREDGQSERAHEKLRLERKRKPNPRAHQTGGGGAGDEAQELTDP